MVLHPTVLKWVLYVSAAKIFAFKLWGLIVFLAYAMIGGIILGAEWVWTSFVGMF